MKDKTERPCKWKDIPDNLKKELVGEYTAGIIRCVECESPIVVGCGLDESLFPQVFVGIGKSWDGIFQIYECPKCFTKQYYHIRSMGALITLLRLLELTKEKYPTNQNTVKGENKG